ncbi:hypothetical protein NC651_013766 [Populus alba x Populus x berolinensis]|nr:hypothetical protein NC651_013766 [Populus alba x Populus x berolinensis]
MLCIILLLLCLTFMFHGRAWQSTRSNQHRPSGHATGAAPKNALSAEESMGPHGLLHIIQG